MLPTDVTIRNWNSKASAWGFAPRTSCRLPIEHCALLVVNVPRLYEARRRGPIILALLPRDGKRVGREGEKETGGAITGGGVRIHLIENLYILRIYQTIIR